MRINELLSETHHTDEGVGQFLGKAAGAVGGAVGGVQGAWQGMKNVYGQNRDRVAKVAQRNVQRGGRYRTPAPTNVAPSPGGTTPTAGTPPNTTGTEDPKALRAQAAELNQKANAIEKQKAAASAPTAPQGQALDLDQLKKDQAARQAAAQAGQQQAQQQMAATQQANAATNQQDAAIKAAADAARAKPPFQQTAADKLAIKAADDKGIREEDEIAEGFRSNFLGIIL